MYSDKKYFSIGEVAKLKNVTAKALRYYHDIGLLAPSYVDESNGYRYYSLEQLIHLDIIKICRNAGVSIKELQKLYSCADMEYLIQFLKDKNKVIQEKIKQLEETELMVKTLTDKIEESQIINKTVGFHVKHFPERYLITSPLTQAVGFQHIFDYFQLEDIMNGYGIKSKYEQGIFYNLSINGELESTSVFAVIDKEKFFSNELDSSFMKLPSGYFLTYTFSKEKEELELEQVFRYLHQKKLHADFILSFDLYNEIFNIDDYRCQAQVYIGKNPPPLQ